MSYQDFKKATLLAPQCEYFTTVGGVSQSKIMKSQDLLGVKFSTQNSEFYRKFGYLSFFGTEIFGIDPDDDSGVLEGNSVAFALNDRREFNLPTKWIPIYNYGDGSMAYLDYSCENTEQEPRIIMGRYNGEEHVMENIVADDLGEFLLSLVEQQLAIQ